MEAAIGEPPAKRPRASEQYADLGAAASALPPTAFYRWALQGGKPLPVAGDMLTRQSDADDGPYESFPRQAQAFAAADDDAAPGTRSVWSVEPSAGPRRFVAASAQRFWGYILRTPPANRHAYEILRGPCHLFLDLGAPPLSAARHCPARFLLLYSFTLAIILGSVFRKV